MLVDVLIGVLLAAVIVRGHTLGFVRQLLLAVGFITGLFLGAAVQPYAMAFADTVLSRALLSIMVTVGGAVIVGRLGESVGIALKSRIHQLMPLNRADAVLGSATGVATVLTGIWLLTPIVSSVPSPEIQQAISSSAVISTLDRKLPSAPDFISSIDRLINPNGFPDVFAGLDRQPLQPDAPLPSLGELQTAVQQARHSIVKLEGRGCGGIVEGSGFVAADDIIMTNAHVVAGVAQPTVVDTNGRHNATVIWFDPDLDMAILRTTGLAGGPLQIKTDVVANNTASVVVGYPGGGGFTASPAVVLDQLSAQGRDIYGRELTNRSIYELKADIIPGNSGGPLLDKDGKVIGLIFAESVTYENIGYALTMQPVASGLQQAIAQNRQVATGACAAG